jgi:diaminopimelate epimerase
MTTVYLPQDNEKDQPLIIADPAGNITAFAQPPEDFRAAALRIMAAYPAVEQVGFVFPPDAGEAVHAGTRRLWRLCMAGGEFCGNAARSFGLFVARETGLRGKTAVDIEISGSDGPLTVSVDTETGDAEVMMPLPTSSVPLQGAASYAVSFDGITHIIAEGAWADAPEEVLNRRFLEIKRMYDEAASGSPSALFCSLPPGFPRNPPAFGVLFYDTAKDMLRPAVFVAALGVLVFERSCGSGSAAFACYKTAGLADGEYAFDVRQSGGVIRARVIKERGEVQKLSIGGRVSLTYLA